MSNAALNIITLLGLILAIPSEAHAYTDPGSGALIWQFLVAAFIGGMFYLRKLVSWFKSEKKNKKQ